MKLKDPCPFITFFFSIIEIGYFHFIPFSMTYQLSFTKNNFELRSKSLNNMFDMQP